MGRLTAELIGRQFTVEIANTCCKSNPRVPRGKEMGRFTVVDKSNGTPVPHKKKQQKKPAQAYSTAHTLKNKNNEV